MIDENMATPFMERIRPTTQKLLQQKLNDHHALIDDWRRQARKLGGFGNTPPPPRLFCIDVEHIEDAAGYNAIYVNENGRFSACSISYERANDIIHSKSQLTDDATAILNGEQPIEAVFVIAEFVPDIDCIVDNVLNTWPKQVQQYRDGKQELMGFFVGQVLRMVKKDDVAPSDIIRKLDDKMTQ